MKIFGIRGGAFFLLTLPACALFLYQIALNPTVALAATDEAPAQSESGPVLWG